MSTEPSKNHIPSKEHLRNAFQENLVQSNLRLDCREALRLLTDTVKAMSDVGADVSLTLQSLPGQRHAEIFSGLYKSNIGMFATGILRIGNGEQLIAMASNFDSKGVLVMGVSKYDHRYCVVNTAVPADIYDMGADLNRALRAFASKTLKLCANEQKLHTAAGNGRTRLDKPGLDGPG
jgi:hypothetical protein